SKLSLAHAANFGGRWENTQAAGKLLGGQPRGARGFNPGALDPVLVMADGPEPDLFNRTGGEQRFSNFLLWQLAYTELYFTDLLWPDFDAGAMRAAIESYGMRERPYRRTTEQVQANAAAQVQHA